MNATKQNRAFQPWRGMLFYLIDKHMQNFRHFCDKPFKFSLDVVLTFQRLPGLAAGINSASNMCENGP